MLTAREAISNVLVLRAAWMRMDAWYRGGGLAQEPELSRWRLHPEAQLRKLSNELLEGTWEPEPWLQVPYPKKNACLRHYVMPTVRDQVAFMAHLVLLGPLLDVQMHSFAFGNRWYRPMVWNRRQPTPKWESRPYPFATNNIYLPYSRSHGLFKRATHWTVAQMTKTRIRQEDYAGRVQHFEDYEADALPPWTRGEWWGGAGRDRAYWAALDIQMAYPSILLGRLASDLQRMLAEGCRDARDVFQGCPDPIVDALRDEAVRMEIAGRLGLALGGVKIKPGPIKDTAWGLPEEHWLPRLQREGDTGLPTGLAVSGMLLNVALHEADETVMEYLEGTSGDSRGAFVRFADDMYVMSRSVEGVLKLVEAVDMALAGTNGGALAAPNEDSNLCLNFSKIRPEPVRKVVGHFLKASGWKSCPTCKEPLPPDESPIEPEAIVDWWRRLGNKKRARHAKALDRTTIGEGNVGPFVTALVERLSELGTDTLDERFGDGARSRIARLHELARFEIDDEQVRPETRRTFSVNRLVRAWPPSDMEAQVVRDIRETVASVLGSTPWQVNLWRAVVRAAARRPGSGMDRSSHREAADWLRVQLRRIALEGDAADSMAWRNVWPEEPSKPAHKRKGWRRHYLSFHRATFWRAVSEALRDLGRHEARFGIGSAERRDPSPNEWTVRAVPEGAHRDVADWLGRLDEWARVLYPGGGGSGLSGWPWEIDALAGAVLTSHRTSAIAEALRHAASPAGLTLRVPATDDALALRLCAGLLGELGRLVALRRRPQRRLGPNDLVHVSFGQPDGALSTILFPQDGRARINGGTRTRTPVMAALALGCFEDVRLRWALDLVPRRKARANAFRKEPLALREYGQAREVVVGQQVYRGPATLHRGLWGTPQSGPLTEWPLRAWETPALGLPTAMAIGLFAAAREQEPPAEWTAADGPLNWAINDAGESLARTRRRQFGRQFSSLGSGSRPRVDGGSEIKVTRTLAWELLAHEAFYLPFAALCGERDSEEVHAASYLLYCDVLLLLTALDGRELILDELARHGAGERSFEDRWGWRSRIHLSASAWRNVEKVLRWSERPRADETELGGRLLASLEAGVVLKDLVDPVVERIDVGLRVGEDNELVRGVSQAIGVPELPPELRSTENLAREFVVRIGQVTAWPEMQEVVGRFPGMGWSTAAAIMKQVASVFSPSREGTGGAKPELVLLPESTVPYSEVDSLRRLVGRTGIASLAGLYWRPVSPAYRPTGGRSASWRCFVNEAELVVPEGHRDRGPTTIRWFRVRKLVPAHIEDGLALALTLKNPSVRWSILPGHRWYRFVHPRWGDFSIAICADLIDAEPWRSLRGELLHLLMVAYNPDVDLYDALTWVRAYENYVNVASVNHGKIGGSFVWTPRHAHGRELAKLRGGGLFLKADVRLPVRALRRAQLDGVNDAVLAAAAKWQANAASDPKFKSPPPGFVARKP